MRITIIAGNDDNSVYIDGVSTGGLDFSNCGLPDNFWALQWGENNTESGHIEFNSPLIQNQEITELPSWVQTCIDLMNVKKAEEEAAEAAAQAAAAAEAASQQETTENEPSA